MTVHFFGVTLKYETEYYTSSNFRRSENISAKFSRIAVKSSPANLEISVKNFIGCRKIAFCPAGLF